MDIQLFNFFFENFVGLKLLKDWFLQGTDLWLPLQSEGINKLG